MNTSTSESIAEPELPDVLGTAAPPQSRAARFRKVGLRFLVPFFLLLTHPFHLDLVPTPDRFKATYGVEWSWLKSARKPSEALQEYLKSAQEVEQKVVGWTAEVVFGLPTAPRPTELWSDGTYDHIRLLVVFVFACAVCLIWSILAHARLRHDFVGAWFHLAGRYYLGFSLLIVGLPMALGVWFGVEGNLMGEFTLAQLEVANLFGAAMALIPGLEQLVGGWAVFLAGLLFFRSTATVGAFLTALSMLAAVALCVLLGCPYKLAFLELLVIAGLLALPDLRRAFAVLVQQRGVAPRAPSRPRIPGVIGHPLRILVVGIPVVLHAIAHQRSVDAMEGLSELPGIWDVTSYSVGGEERTPRTDDWGRWDHITVRFEGFAAVRDMAGHDAMHLRLSEENGTAEFYTFEHYRYRIEGDEMLLEVHAPSGPLPGMPQGLMLTHRLKRTTASGSPASVQMAGQWQVVETKVPPHLPRLYEQSALPLAILHLDPETGTATVVSPAGTRDRYALGIDEKNSTLTISRESQLTLRRPTPDQLILEGTLSEQPVEIHLERRPAELLRPHRQPFRWIQD